jgi:hypothetical protein
MIMTIPKFSIPSHVIDASRTQFHNGTDFSQGTIPCFGLKTSYNYGHRLGGNTTACCVEVTQLRRSGIFQSFCSSNTGGSANVEWAGLIAHN